MYKVLMLSVLFIIILHFFGKDFLFWFWCVTFDLDVGNNDTGADVGDAIGALHAVVVGVTGATGATVTDAGDVTTFGHTEADVADVGDAIGASHAKVVGVTGATGATITVAGHVTGVVDTMAVMGVLSDVPCVVVSDTSVTDAMAKGDTAAYSSEGATGVFCGVTCDVGAMCDVGVTGIE